MFERDTHKKGLHCELSEEVCMASFGMGGGCSFFDPDFCLTEPSIMEFLSFIELANTCTRDNALEP